MGLLQMTASGEQHGHINTIGNSVTERHKNFTGEAKAKVEKEYKEDHRLVKVRYINHRGKNERLTKPYCRYGADPIETWHFIPGYEYEVPLGLVKEVNEKKLVQRAGLVSQDGKNVRQDGNPTDKDQPSERIHEFVAVSI